MRENEGIDLYLFCCFYICFVVFISVLLVICLCQCVILVRMFEREKEGFGVSEVEMNVLFFLLGFTWFLLLFLLGFTWFLLLCFWGSMGCVFGKRLSPFPILFVSPPFILFFLCYFSFLFVLFSFSFIVYGGVFWFGSNRFLFFSFSFDRSFASCKKKKIKTI